LFFHAQLGKETAPSTWPGGGSGDRKTAGRVRLASGSHQPRYRVLAETVKVILWQ
jgi:hypothetical protein